MSILMKETKKQKVSSSTKNKEHPSAKKSTYKNNNDSQGILNLHSSIGNQATQKLLNATGIQAKLTLSSPSDSYEREADRVADKVLTMPDAKIQTKSPITIQRKPESRSNTQELSSHTESKINSLYGSGEPLSSQTRSFFEPRFGEDFSKVRVHTDSSSNALASSINARAFTKGNDIVFGPSEYAPHSASGKRLLGHELTHVVQQKNSLSTHVNRKKPQGIVTEGTPEISFYYPLENKTEYEYFIDYRSAGTNFLRAYYRAMKTGLDNVSNFLSHQSIQDTSFQWTNVVNNTLDYGANKLIDTMPPILKESTAAAKMVTQSIIAESKRVSQAKDDVLARDFLIDVNTKMSKNTNKNISIFFQTVERDYKNYIRFGGKIKVIESKKYLGGKKGNIIYALKKEIKRLNKASGREDPTIYEEKLWAVWMKTSKAQLSFYFRGGSANVFSSDDYYFPPKFISINISGSKGGNIKDGLKRIIKKSNKKITDLKIPKTVYIILPNNMWGGESYGIVKFDKDSKYISSLPTANRRAIINMRYQLRYFPELLNKYAKKL